MVIVKFDVTNMKTLLIEILFFSKKNHPLKPAGIQGTSSWFLQLNLLIPQVLMALKHLVPYVLIYIFFSSIILLTSIKHTKHANLEQLQYYCGLYKKIVIYVGPYLAIVTRKRVGLWGGISKHRCFVRQNESVKYKFSLSFFSYYFPLSYLLFYHRDITY